MSNSPLTFEDEVADAPVAAAVANPIADVKSRTAAKPAKPSNGEGCPNCESIEPWGVSSWCPACGYYPALGGQAKAACSQIFQTTHQEEKIQLKHFLPLWAVVLVAGAVAIVVLSFVASSMLPERGIERLLWTLSQCALGMVAAAIGQISAFLYAASKDDKYGPLDAIMRPIDIWKMSTRSLPVGAWRYWLASWGLTAAICGATIVGALRYEALFEDWGAVKAADQNVLQKVVAEARQEREGGADNLNDAMNEFVGDAEDADPLAKLPTMDCLIFGYVESDTGDLEAILLASVVGKDVKYVGRVPASNIPKESRGKLFARMKGLTRKKPFVQTNQEARWLQPVLMARIAYTDMTSDSQMIKAYVKVMLADLKEEKK